MTTPWNEEWQLAPGYLPGKSQGQRSRMDYSMGLQKSDMTERLITHTHTRSWQFVQRSCVNLGSLPLISIVCHHKESNPVI